MTAVDFFTRLTSSTAREDIDRSEAINHRFLPKMSLSKGSRARREVRVDKERVCFDNRIQDDIQSENQALEVVTQKSITKQNVNHVLLTEKETILATRIACRECYSLSQFAEVMTAGSLHDMQWGTPMILLKVLSGPHAGKERVVPEGFDPNGLLTEFASKDWKWSVEFSEATQLELLDWGRADMVARILAALLHGRSVWFQGTEYRVERQADLPRVASKVEDAIAYSGLMVKVESDNRSGVTIGTGDPEFPVQ